MYFHRVLYVVWPRISFKSILWENIWQSQVNIVIRILHRVRHHVSLGQGWRLLSWLLVILDIDWMNQSSQLVRHNRLSAQVQPRSRHQFRQLSREDHSWIVYLNISEASGSRMRCEWIRDHDSVQTQDDDSTVQTMLPLYEISLNRDESCNVSDGCDGLDGCDGHDACDSGVVEFYG